MDLREALTRKIGPLPAWGWGVAIGGGLLAIKLVRGGSATGSNRETLVVPTGAPQPSGDYLGQFSDALADLRNELGDIRERLDDDGAQVPSPSQPPPPTSQPSTPGRTQPVEFGVGNTPRGFDIGTWLQGLRARFPDIARRATSAAVPGETPAQRQARLARELPYYGTAGKAFDLGTYVIGLRKMYGDQFMQAAPKGETPTQRTARLWAEVSAFARSGKTALTQPTTTPAPSVT